MVPMTTTRSMHMFLGFGAVLGFSYVVFGRVFLHALRINLFLKLSNCPVTTKKESRSPKRLS